MTLDALCKVRNPFEGRDAQADDVLRRPQSDNSWLKRVVEAYEAFAQGRGSRIMPLTPEQLHMAQAHFMKRSRRESHNSEKFMQRLLMSSYRKGYNGFVLDASTHWFPYGLPHYEGKRLRLIIVGDVDPTMQYRIEGLKDADIVVQGNIVSSQGNMHAYNVNKCDNCVLEVTGNIGDLVFVDSVGSSHIIHGSTGDHCGRGANKSRFEVDGNVGNCFGSIGWDSQYTIHSNAGDSCFLNLHRCVVTIYGQYGKEFGYNSTQTTFRVQKRFVDALRKLEKGTENRIEALP